MNDAIVSTGYVHTQVPGEAFVAGESTHIWVSGIGNYLIIFDSAMLCGHSAILLQSSSKLRLHVSSAQ